MSTPHATSTPAVVTYSSRRRQPLFDWKNLGDSIFWAICRLAAVLIIALFVLLVVELVIHSGLALRTFGLSVIMTADWDPGARGNEPVYGMLAYIWGTLATSAIAMVIAVPLGVGTAAFLAEIAPAHVRRVASFLIEMLAAIPSVVYGFWGLFFLAPVVQEVIVRLGGPKGNSGLSVLTAGLILSIMIVPYIAAVSYDVCRAVPRSQREGALALGATRWQTIWSVILPYARPGIVGGAFLALGRALGETMAVTMLIGKDPKIPAWWSPLDTGDSIPSAIANNFPNSVTDLERSVLVEMGLVLLLVTVVVNTLARLLIWRVGKVRKSVQPWWSFWKREAESSPTSSEAVPSTMEQKANPRAQRVDQVMTGVLSLTLVVTLGPLFLILGYLIYRGIGSLSWDFFVKLPVSPLEKGGGLANALVGSAKIVGMATLLATPLGLLSAIYLAEYRGGRLGGTIRFIGELLAGIPSIVIGIFAYMVVIRPRHFGFELYGWGGVFALMVMMIPIVMRASEESLKLVPQTLRNASYALGASQWQTVLRVSVPAALPAIITGVFLAIARIAGETAPLILTTGFNQFWPTSLNDNTPALPEYIWKYSMSPYENQRQLAWGAAFVLLLLVMVLNFGIRFLTGKRVILASRAD
jgi:phosphate transport system permease protein